jgi:hypothetical protein
MKNSLLDKLKNTDICLPITAKAFEDYRNHLAELYSDGTLSREEYDARVEIMGRRVLDAETIEEFRNFVASYDGSLTKV